MVMVFKMFSFFFCFFTFHPFLRVEIKKMSINQLRGWLGLWLRPLLFLLMAWIRLQRYFLSVFCASVISVIGGVIAGVVNLCHSPSVCSVAMRLLVECVLGCVSKWISRIGSLCFDQLVCCGWNDFSYHYEITFIHMLAIICNWICN